MCSLAELCDVIAAKSPRYSKNTLQKGNPVFMYVKHYCGYSKKACNTLLDSSDVTIVELIKKEFVSYDSKTNSFTQEFTDVPKRILDAFVDGDTVPQIFVYNNNQWSYIGGCEELLNKSMSGNGYNSGYSIGKMSPAVALKL